MASGERTVIAPAVKSEFVPIVIHERYLPLDAVSKMLELLHQKASPPTHNNRADIEQRARENLLILTNKILDFARSASTKQELYRHHFSLDLLLQACVRIFGPKAKEAGLSLTLRVSDALGQGFWGDQACLRQIVFLLMGAILRTPSGEGIRVSAYQNKKKLQIDVEHFCQETAPIRDILFDLRLSIARELVALHGGKMLVNTCNAVNVFSVQVPWLETSECSVQQDSEDKVLTADSYCFLSHLTPIYPVFFNSRRQELEYFERAFRSQTLDWEQIERIGHSLKGSGASFGFPVLSGFGGAIEALAQEQDRQRVKKIYRQLAAYLFGIQPQVEFLLYGDD